MTNKTKQKHPVYDWQKITILLVGRLGIDCVSQTGELSIKSVNELRSGRVLEPCHSSGELMFEIYEHFFPKRINEVII